MCPNPDLTALCWVAGGGQGRVVLAVWFYRIAEHCICAHIVCGIYTLCVYTGKRDVQQTCLAVGVEGSELCNGPLVSLGAPSPQHLRSGRAERDVCSAPEHLSEKGFASPAQAACSRHCSSTGGFVPCSRSFMDPSCLNNSFFLYP